MVFWSTMRRSLMQCDAIHSMCCLVLCGVVCCGASIAKEEEQQEKMENLCSWQDRTKKDWLTDSLEEGRPLQYILHFSLLLHLTASSSSSSSRCILDAVIMMRMMLILFWCCYCCCHSISSYTITYSTIIMMIMMMIVFCRQCKEIDQVQLH